MALVVDSEMASNVGFGVSGPPPTSPQTFSFTNTAGTVLYLILILGVNSGGTTAFGAVTYNGVAMTLILEQTTASGASRIGVFRLLNPATGSNTVSVGFTESGSPNYAVVSGCISFSGNDATTPEVQTAGANGSSATASASLSGVVAGNISFAGAAAGSDMTAQTQTLSWAKNVNGLSQAGNGRSSRSASSGSVTHSFTISLSDSWITAVIEVAAAGSAAAVVPFVPHRMPLGV